MSFQPTGFQPTGFQTGQRVQTGGGANPYRPVQRDDDECMLLVSMCFMEVLNGSHEKETSGKA